MQKNYRIKLFAKGDIRRGANKLHAMLDGKIIIPDKVVVALLAVGGAVVPPLAIWLIWKGGI